MTLDELLSHFEGVTEDHDGTLMQCPAHNDSQASLKLIVHENGKVGIVCRAGCSSADVVKASKLPWSAFFNVTGASNIAPSAAPSAVTGPPVTRLAVYIDASRERYEGSPAEEYAWERFGIDGETATRLELGYDDGVGFAHTHTAYKSFPRLVVPFPDSTGRPHALQGRDVTGGAEEKLRWVGLTNPDNMAWGRYAFWRVNATGPVIVSEGPGDGLTAVAAGFDALAIRGAALASAEGLVEALKGRAVVVAGDADTAGQKFNEKVRELLEPHGIKVYALPIPAALGNKADLTDWRAIDPADFPASLSAAVETAMTPRKEVEGIVQTSLERSIGVDVVTKEDGKRAARAVADMMTRIGVTDRGLPSDAANAHALVAYMGGRIKYSKGLGFFVWDEQTWVNHGEDVRELAHAMAAALMLAGNSGYASGFNTTARVDNLLKELRSVPSVRIEAEAFDRNPDLLSFRNGTANLRNGSIRPHLKEDMITVCLDLNYDPNAKCPRWETFISEVMPGMPEMPAYLQRLLGYGITGSTDEQCFAVLFGKGANGKSVFSDTIKEIFKDVTKGTPVATFEDKASGSIPNDLAALRDARIVMASEGESGKPMSEALLKRATGDMEIQARFMRQEWFSFTPRFLILLATNHKPQFRGQDDGLWRRVKLVPWARYFRPEERDHGLQKRLMKEKEGIAAWVVRGAIDWYANGLQDPDVIKEATKGYRESSNPLDEFCPGMYEITGNDNDSVSGSALYLDYVDWCQANGLQRGDVWKRPTMYRALEDLGASKGKDRKGVTLYRMRKVEAGPVQEGPGIFA